MNCAIRFLLIAFEFSVIVRPLSVQRRTSLAEIDTALSAHRDRDVSNGAADDVTSQAMWQSSNADATVSSSGVVTTSLRAPVVVQETYQSVTGSESITIP